jgi:beta-mannosidase
MARVRAINGEAARALTGWRMALSPAGACAGPQQAAALTGWIDAPVPGTAAGALSRKGLFDPASPTPLHDHDIWWRCALPGGGPSVLAFDGIATVAQAWIDGQPVLISESMFLRHEVEADLQEGQVLWLVCRSLAPALDRKLPRARWRTFMIPRQGLRGLRTTLLGHMPGWTPAVDAIGPWRPVTVAPAMALKMSQVNVQAEYDALGGRLIARLRLEGAHGPVHLRCAGRSTRLIPDSGQMFDGILDLPDVEPWWPHTHGGQPLYPVTVDVDGQTIDLGRAGFRSLQIERGADGKGFGLIVNGHSVFCRGANWTTPDIVDLPGDAAAYRPLLELAREAGMNMLRIGGTGVYESPAFFDLCDELGILVWQDFMFANFDYPVSDPAFEALVRAEAAQVLDATQLSPSLAIVCGGSEALQQAAMMGLDPAKTASALYDKILPALAAQYRPHTVYVDNSPTGGPLPFVPNEGVAHYFGVGAYTRPLEDARRADVRFASECLAFANLPDGGDRGALLAGVGVPRDLNADWDFADVRDHYLLRLCGHDPAALRGDNPDLYLDLSRWVTGAVMEATFTEWRRARSTCRGGLVWMFKDLAPGAGWGVVDSAGRPKPAWFALKRAFQPLHIGLTDEGGAGLAIHLVNEGPDERALALELACFKADGGEVLRVSKRMVLQPRSAGDVSAFSLIGSFYDLNRAYRFGPASHAAVVVRLREGGRIIAEASHFPETDAPVQAPVIQAAVQGNLLTLATDRPLRAVVIETEGLRPSDNGFAMMPDEPTKIALSGSGPTHGQVRAIFERASVRF